MFIRQASVANSSGSSRRGGIIGVILVIVVAFVCALVIASVLVVKTIKVHGTNGNRVMIETPAGSLGIHSNQKVDLESAGIPVYPGAELAGKHKNGVGASFEWTSNDGKTEKSATIAGAEYITHDAVDKVLTFYRGKLNNWIFVTRHNDKFEFEHTEGTWKRFVSIAEHDDGTHIGVASIGEPAGN